MLQLETGCWREEMAFARRSTPLAISVYTRILHSLSFRAIRSASWATGCFPSSIKSVSWLSDLGMAFGGSESKVGPMSGPLFGQEALRFANATALGLQRLNAIRAH